jgi:DNA mismatch repair ATPase MutS
MSVMGERKYMSFSDIGGKIVFQYKLIDGISPSSFAISAARKAGVSEDILNESNSIGCVMDTKQVNQIDIQARRLAHLLSLLP